MQRINQKTKTLARISALFLLCAGNGCSCSADEPLADGGAGEAGPTVAQAEREVAAAEQASEREENPLPLSGESEPPPEAPPEELENEEEPPQDPAEPQELSPEEQARLAEEERRRRYPLEAVAYQFVTNVVAEPSRGASARGYLRRGARVRVAESTSRRGCRRGWHEVEGGGYVCRGSGVVVGENPDPWPDAPPPPRLEDPLPYDYYTVIRDDIPEYWERPSAAQKRETSAAIAQLRAPPPEEETAPEEPGDDGGPGGNDGGAAEADVAQAPDQGPADAGAADADGGEQRILPTYVRMLLARGFIVSAAGFDGPWLTTVRGRAAERDYFTQRDSPDHQGVTLGDDRSLPLAFVTRGRAKALRPVQGPTLRFEVAGTLRRLAALPMLGELMRGDQRYVSVGRGLVARENVVTIAEQVDPPPGIGPEDRWIDVDLARQTLVAYEGERAVYATLISSGRSSEGFGTPTGTFRILTKHVSATMDDPDGGDEAYSIEDVPWTMYFQDSYALHGAFWHSRFGSERSHGCVNLSPADARWLFFWAAPALPPGWHGIRATRDNPGTTIVIH